MGYRVNVNAVTAQTNNFAGNYAPNVVQDYALVISSGDGQITNAMVVTTTPIVSNPTGDQQITYVSGNSGTLNNQFVGANTPLMGTNALLIGLTNSFTTNELNGVTNWQITIGMTNQWHFYVVTNTLVSTNSAFTNAAFVTYIPDTLSIPRMGVFESTVSNATRPEADIDIYVSTDPNLTNLVSTVINGAATNYLASINAGTNSTPGTTATAGGTFQMASLGRGGTEYVVDTNSQKDEVYYIGVKSEDQMASEYAFLPVFSATPFSQMNPNGDQIVTGVGVPVAIPGGNSAVPGYVDVIAIAIYPIQARRVVITNTFNAQDFGDLVGAVNHNGTSVILNNHDSLNTPGTYTFIYDDSGQGDIIGSQPSDGPGTLRSYTGQEGAGVWILHEANNVGEFANAVDNFNLMIQPHRAKGDTTIFEITAPCGWFYDYIDVPPGATNLTITVTNLTTSPQTESLYVKYGDSPTLTSFDEMVVIDPTGTPPTNSISIGPPLTAGRYYFGVYNPCGNAAQSNSITVTIGYVAASQVDYTSAGPVPILDDAVTEDSIFVPDDATIYSVDVGLNVEHPRISDLVFHLISPDGTRILLVENRGGTDTNGMGTTNSYLVLTENTNLTTTPIKFAPPPFAATNDLFYLPEQPMDSLAGQNAYGTWTLEIQDDRAGANLTNWLASWQLRFIFTSPAVAVLAGGQPQTNSIPSGGIIYYSVAVPTNANFATNLLLFATGPVNVWFNQTNLPSGSNPSDYLLLGHATGGFSVLSLISSPTNIVPGRTYYIGVQNTNSVAVTNAFEVDFHFIPPPTPLTDGVPQTNSVPSGSIVYYTVSVPVNADYATNMLLFATASVNVWFNQNTPPSGTNPPNYLLITNALNGTNVLSTNTVPLLVPGQTYYIGVQNTNSVAVMNAFEVDFHLIPPVALTNGVPATNSVPAGSITYYSVTVPINAFAATNLLFATGSVNVWFNQTNLPSGTGWPGDYLLITNALTGTNVLSTNSVLLPPLVPGQTYYIGVQNTNSVNVTNAFEVDFAFAPISFQPQTNSIPSGDIIYYAVSVPVNADYATNLLLFATGPVNVWFNQTNLPGGANPPDYLLITNTTTGTNVLSTNTVPSLVPGQTYYIGVQNTNSSAVTNAFEVDFHLIPLITITNGVSATNSIASGSIVYYSVLVPGDAGFATNMLLSATGPVNVWFNQNTLPIGANPPDSLLITNTTTGTKVLSTNSVPLPPLMPGQTYYIGVQNTNSVAVTNAFEVDFDVTVSPFSISAANITSSGARLQWVAPPSDRFKVEWATNISPPIVWTTNANIITSGNGTFTFTDSSATNSRARFYRLLQVQ